MDAAAPTENQPAEASVEPAADDADDSVERAVADGDAQPAEAVAEPVADAEPVDELDAARPKPGRARRGRCRDRADGMGRAGRRGGVEPEAAEPVAEPEPAWTAVADAEPLQSGRRARASQRRSPKPSPPKRRGKSEPSPRRSPKSTESQSEYALDAARRRRAVAEAENVEAVAEFEAVPEAELVADDAEAVAHPEGRPVR